MSQKSCFLIYFVLLLLLLQSEAPLSAQTKPAEQSKSEIRPFTDLTFEIVLPEQTLLLLQPIPIIIKQSNKTNQPVLGYNTVGFDNSPMILEIQK